MNNFNKSMFKDIYYHPYKNNRIKLYNHAKDNVDLLQRLSLIKSLPIHQGCVNTLSWNETGEYLLSGSDDQHLIVTHGHKYRVLHDYTTSHRANIFSAKFLPGSADKQIISCSGDGIILHTDLEKPADTYYNQFNCHSGTTYEVITIPNDPHTFISCGEDGTVRWFDLRTKNRCKKPRCKDDVMIVNQRAVTALSINPLAVHQLAIGCSDSTVRIFDRRCLSTQGAEGVSVQPLCSFMAPDLEERPYRITSLCYSPDGQDILVSYSSDQLYLFGIQENREVPLKKSSKARGYWDKVKAASKRERRSPPPVRRLRLRGDWSDTGPDARPERDSTSTVSIGQARPQLHATLMQRMTHVLSRMLNDPLTRAALSAGGEDSLDAAATDPAAADPTATNRQRQLSEDGQETTRSVSESQDSAPQPTASTNNSQPPENVFDNQLPEVPADMDTSDYGEPASEGTSQTTQPRTTDDQEPEQQETPSSQEAEASTSRLRDHISSLEHLRHGFIEQTGSEPSVSLKYSLQGSSMSTISLQVGNDRVSDSFIDNDIDNENDSLPNSQQPIAGTSDGHRNNSSTVQGTSTLPSTSTNNDSLPAGGDDENLDLDQDMMDVGSPTANVVNDSIEVDVPSDLMPDNSVSDVELDYETSDDENEAPYKYRNHEAGAPRKRFFDDGSCGFEPHMKMKYTGHRNARTMIKEATFWGNDYVMSGSDCGHVFVWDRKTAQLSMLLEADQHVVNCLQPHPTLPLLATSGIDHDVKLWAPLLEQPSFDTKMAEDLVKRNEIMLEETRDTITVPAAFMIRMLACLNQIRRGGRVRIRRRDEEDSS